MYHLKVKFNNRVRGGVGGLHYNLYFFAESESEGTTAGEVSRDLPSAPVWAWIRICNRCSTSLCCRNRDDFPCGCFALVCLLGTSLRRSEHVLQLVEREGPDLSRCASKRHPAEVSLSRAVNLARGSSRTLKKELFYSRSTEFSSKLAQNN